MPSKAKTILAMSAFLPAISLAAVPTAFMENAQIVATGQKIQVFRAPTRDINGAIKYYNIDITLNVKNDGTIDPIATGVPAANASSIVAAASPNVQGTKFIAGSYKDVTGTATCTVNVTTLIGGRSQTAISCNTTSHAISLTAVTGVITGHPFQLDLLAAGIDKISGYQNFAWGKVGVATTTWFGCMFNGEVISASQVGNSIQLSGYDLGNIQKCGTTLIKQ